MLNKCPEYASFEIAQMVAKSSGIQSEEEWREVDDLGGLPQEIPSQPEIYYANGSGHIDNLNFTTGWVPNTETEYALSINGSETIQTGLNIVKKFNGFDLMFNIETDLLYENRNQNANISLNKAF